MVSPVYSNYWYSELLVNYLLSPGVSSYSYQPVLPINAVEEILLKNNWVQQQPSLVTNSLVSLNNYARQLWEASQPLQLGTTDNVFLKRVATSSVPGAVTAQAQPGATLATYTVTVSQLAAAQQNLGTALASNAAAGLAAGTYTFSLQAGGKTYTISFAVNSGDTNLTVLNSMANALNAAGAPVTAKVATDTVAGTSRLVLTASNTGTGNAFTLADITGNAVAYTGANTVSVAAANASYTVNGIPYTSQSNTVYLDNLKLTLNLLAPVSSATVTVAPDTQAISTAVNNFVAAYNNLITFTAQNSQYISPQIVSSLKQAYSYQAANLAAIGITRNPDGTLVINQSTLTNALQSNLGAVEAAFSGVNGLAVTAGFEAQQIFTAPLTTFINPFSLVSTTAGAASYYPLYNWMGLSNAASLWSVLLPPGSLFNQIV
ncbi:flagellar filament capping protein FliD [Desulfofundulus sp.]|uniref:flagellar filament capping protein FliD n=1 Tax=Desulfofundulus sp. TaxID=2282750 RepID=UPI003C790E31